MKRTTALMIIAFALWFVRGFFVIRSLFYWFSGIIHLAVVDMIMMFIFTIYQKILMHLSRDIIVIYVMRV